MGMRVGLNFKRLHGVILDPAHCWLISIGDNVTLAPRVHVLAHDASTLAFIGYTRIGRVVIGSNVFIGGSAIVLPNVRIGDNVVVGANSTVSRDLPANGVYAGNPARLVCGIDEFVRRNTEAMLKRPCYGEEYTLRLQVDQRRKQEMIDQLATGHGYVV
jgi:maltose O-acetyltransferase